MNPLRELNLLHIAAILGLQNSQGKCHFRGGRPVPKTEILPGLQLLEDRFRMNSLDAFEKRLRDETATVEQEIQLHNQQLEALNKRLEGLRRAGELLESEEAAIVELLQTGTVNRRIISREMPTARAARQQQRAIRSKTAAARKQVNRSTPSRSETKTAPNARTARHNGLTRVDMIAAVLRRHPRRTVRELIALLDKEYHWKTTESAVTGHLYTRRNKFVHIPPDRAVNRPVTWSAK
jgi:hypothetical protein